MTTIHDKAIESMADEQDYQIVEPTVAFAAIMELFMGPIAECGQASSLRADRHGWVRVLETGHNSGFAGEGLWWANYSCGCQWVEEGRYYDA